jgi:hypothetical protein
MFTSRDVLNTRATVAVHTRTWSMLTASRSSMSCDTPGAARVIASALRVVQGPVIDRWMR